MRTGVVIAILAGALTSALAIGCVAPTYTDDGTVGSHPTTSQTKAAPLPSASTKKSSTQLPPVRVVDDAGASMTTTAPPATPGAPSDAGTTTMTDGGTITPGTMSPSGYQQNPSNPKVTGACGQSDISFYENMLVVKGQGYGDMQKEMRERNTKCASCIFTDLTDETWGPVVMEGNNAGFFNWASCYALAPGGNDKCGDEVQQYFDCLDDVCLSYIDDAAAYSTCQNMAAADAKSCGSLTFDDCADLDALNESCAQFDRALAFACE